MGCVGETLPVPGGRGGGIGGICGEEVCRLIGGVDRGVLWDI